MKIKIEEQALNFLKEAEGKHKDEIPVIGLFKGGCAGHLLKVNYLSKTSCDFKIESVEGFEIAIAPEIQALTDDLLITMKDGIIPEIIVKNQKATQHCKCGKSFKI